MKSEYAIQKEIEQLLIDIWYNSGKMVSYSFSPVTSQQESLITQEKIKTLEIRLKALRWVLESNLDEK